MLSENEGTNRSLEETAVQTRRNINEVNIEEPNENRGYESYIEPSNGNTGYGNPAFQIENL